MKKYKKIYENRRPGLDPVSIWVNMDPKRNFDEIVIGQNITEKNIKNRRFDYPVEFCYCAKGFKKALKKFGIEKYIKRNNSVKNKLPEFAKNIWYIYFDFFI